MTNSKLKPPKEPQTAIGRTDTRTVKFSERFELFRERVHDNRYLLWAFFIPFTIMFLAYVALQTWPFGKGSVMVLDMNGQYIYFFKYLRDVVYGESSLVYSWSRQLGGEFFGTYTYYLASPLSYIVALFPAKYLLEAVWLIILLKVGICGLTMAYFLQKSRPGSKWKACLFGVAYALLGYTFAYSHNVFWMDALMWFPLVILGAEQVIKNKRFTMFVAALALTLMSTFYIGFMVCIFVFLYFFVYYFSRDNSFLFPAEPIAFTGIWKALGFSRFEKIINKTQKRRAIFKFIGTLLRFGFYAALAIGISALILLITNFAMHFGKDSFAMTADQYHYTWRSFLTTQNFSKTVSSQDDWNKLSWFQQNLFFKHGEAFEAARATWGDPDPSKIKSISSYNVTSVWSFNPFESLFKYFPGAGDTVRRETSGGTAMPATPFLYCGLISLVFAPLYFTLKRIPLRRKLAYGGLLFAIGFSMVIKPIDILWHMGQVPNWLYYRYSFMFCFLMILMAYVAFTHLNEIKPTVISVTVSSIFLVLAIVLFQNKDADYSYTSKWGYYYWLICVLASAVFLALIFVFVYFYRKDSVTKKAFTIAITAIVIAEALYSAICGEIVLNMDVSYTNRESYVDFMSRTQPVVDALKQYNIDAYGEEDDFYRMEKTFHRKTNDNMSLDIFGLSNSTSSLNKATIELLRDMGYSSHAHWSKYLGGNPVSDSLLGLRYIMGAYGDTSKTGVEDIEWWPGAGRQEPGKTFLTHYYGASILQEVVDDSLKNNKGEYIDQFIKGQIEAYYNPYALSIAYAVNKNILDVDLSLNPEELGTLKKDYAGNLYGPIDVLNAMVSGMLGYRTDVFVPLEMSAARNIENATSTVPIGFIKPENRVGYIRKTGTDENGKAYKLSLDYTFELTAEKTPVYFYVPLNGYEVDLSLYKTTTYDDGIDDNGHPIVREKRELYSDMGSMTFGGNETARIIYLGMFAAEEGVEYSINVSTSTAYGFLYRENTSFFYTIDETALESAFTELQTAQLNINSKKSTDTHLVGTISIPAGSDKTVLFTTIPYDPSWQVYIDGKKVDIILHDYTRPMRIAKPGGGYYNEKEYLKDETKSDAFAFEDKTFAEPVLQSLVAVYITEGEHTVEFIYRPKSLYQGLAVTGVSIAGFAALIALEFVLGGYKKKSSALEPEYEYMPPSALKKTMQKNAQQRYYGQQSQRGSQGGQMGSPSGQNGNKKTRPQQNGNKK